MTRCVNAITRTLAGPEPGCTNVNPFLVHQRRGRDVPRSHVLFPLQRPRFRRRGGDNTASTSAASRTPRASCSIHSNTA